MSGNEREWVGIAHAAGPPAATILDVSITRSLATWLGLRSDEPAPDAMPEGVRPPSRLNGEQVSIDRALGLSAVYRAIFIWATGASQLTVDVYQGNTVVASPPIVRRPDLTKSRSAFIEETTTSLAATGNAFWKITYKGNDPKAEAVSAVVLSPHLVVPLPNADNTAIAGYSYQGNTLQLWQVKHLQLLRVPGHLSGLGPIQAARAELAGALDVSDYATGWFKRGDIPPGVLTSDQMLNADQAKQYKDAWYTDVNGIKVLGNGLRFAPLLLNPSDAQWIESQNLSVLQVARMFGVPARLLLAILAGGSDTYANMQQEDLSFVRWTLTKVLREIEEAFTDLLSDSLQARFNLDGILRADTTTRYTAYAIALDPLKGWMDEAEVRALEGLAPRKASTKPAVAAIPTGDDTNV